MDHLGAVVCQFDGFFKADLGQRGGIRADTRIGGEHAVHIGPDPDFIRTSGCSKDGGGIVRSPAAQRRRPTLRISAAVSGYDGHNTLIKKRKQRVLALLARRIRLSTGHIEDLVFLDLHGRVAKLLLDQNELLGAPNVIALTQEDLASFVGATRVAVNRVLVDLERQGAVKLGRGQVDLVDLVLLKKAIRY